MSPFCGFANESGKNRGVFLESVFLSVQSIVCVDLVERREWGKHCDLQDLSFRKDDHLLIYICILRVSSDTVIEF